MSSDPWQTGELDDALSHLETAEREPAPAVPPPRPIAEYQGRTPFPNLFELDKEPAGGLRGGPDEKLEYFRRALKKAETAIANFREAWAVREREMDALEALAEREHDAATTTRERLDAFEKLVGEKRSEFDEYGRRIARAFAEKEQIEKDRRDAKRETESQLAREQRERSERELELERAREEHEQTLRREREEPAEALREENQAQEKELRDAKREHEARMREERRQLETRLKEEKELLDTMLREEREQHEHALRAERKKFRDKAEAAAQKHAEELEAHADGKAAAELELAEAQQRIQEVELIERDLRRQLDAVEGREGTAELRTRLEAKERELAAQRELEAELRGEAALAESELYDRIEVLREDVRKARVSADEAGEARRRAEAALEEREGSIRELRSTLETERRQSRDAELLHRDATLEFPGPGAHATLDPEELAKLQRAVAFALKVVGSLLAGAIEEDNQHEVLRRARIALGVARELADKL